ncbi:MAG: anti-sigma factor [Edaphobacter sp.]|uniref:anti-sigma factor domain-containing protein n=1 Tax=Edaphobacter sp. TaxID=1934404 RepID=UPI0023994DFD|nr:anti-sigma factor [Edaphobacter sp.]MDE1175431.1 anti-sigma factor [Edaphobacter sp.]
MSSLAHYDQADLALFALQLLPSAESASMTMHVSGCSYCRQELAQLQGDLASFASIVEPHSPPSQVRDRLLNQVAREKKLAPIEQLEPTPKDVSAPPEQPVRYERSERAPRPVTAPPPPAVGGRLHSRSASLGSARYLDEDKLPKTDEDATVTRLLPRIASWLGWIAAAGIAITAGNLYHQRESQKLRIADQTNIINRLRADSEGARQLLETITDPTARQVTLTPSMGAPVSSGPQGRVIYVTSKGALIFLGSSLEPVETYKTYELWLIPADGRDPIPAGTFHPDPRGNASVILPPLPKGIQAKAFGITLEDDGGSQTPTMPIVMAGN